VLDLTLSLGLQAETLASAQDDLVAEIETDPAIPDPAHEGLDPRALIEFDHHRLADPGIEAALDHRAARRDVDDRDLVGFASEEQGGAVDQAGVAILAASLLEPLRLTVDPNVRKPPEIAHIATSLSAHGYDPETITEILASERGCGGTIESLIQSNRAVEKGNPGPVRVFVTRPSGASGLIYAEIMRGS
jgi:hypothetical protein